MRTLILVAATLLPAAALAQGQPPAATGNAVADAFTRVVDVAYDNVTVGSVRDEGGATLLTDVAATNPTTGASLNIGTVRIENGNASGDDLTAGTITYENFAETEAAAAGTPGTATTVAKMVVTDATLTSAPAEAGMAGPGMLAGNFDTTTLETISVTQGDAGTGPTFTIAKAVADLSTEGDNKTLAFDITDLDITNEALGEGAAQVQALGYDGFSIDMKVDGGWSQAGKLDVQTVRVAADQVGTLEMSLAADGVTEATLAQIGAAGGDFATILGATQAINVSGLTLKYTDEGIVTKLLDKTATDAGVDRAQLVEGAVTQVSAGLAALGNEQFATSVTDAVRTFLNKPGTLTITAQPAQALPLAQVIGGAMMAPGSLPGLLNLQITAQ